MSSRDILSSSAGADGLANGEGALSAASEMGRDRTPRNEPGRCCHDNVPDLAGKDVGLGGSDGFVEVSIADAAGEGSNLANASSLECFAGTVL